jgi:hypothetical protein
MHTLCHNPAGFLPRHIGIANINAYVLGVLRRNCGFTTKKFRHLSKISVVHCHGHVESFLFPGIVNFRMERDEANTITTIAWIIISPSYYS